MGTMMLGEAQCSRGRSSARPGPSARPERTPSALRAHWAGAKPSDGSRGPPVRARRSADDCCRERGAMAVTMSGEFVLPADRATVWARLNDADTLRASIPGCESLEKLSDTELQAAVKVKIGPV